MNYKEILLYGVYSDLRTEVARRFLGFLWWIIDPVLYMAAFYVVFALALRQGGEDYAPFLLIGMVVWNCILAGAGYLLADHYHLIEAWLDPLTYVVLGSVVLLYLYRLVTWRPSGS